MTHFTDLDLLALAWFLFCLLGYSLASTYGPLSRNNLMTAMQERRREWMRAMAIRENRMVDIQIIINLSQGNAFFASTTVIVIGGLAAVLGAGKEALALIGEIPYAQTSTLIAWQSKMLLLIAMFVFAFFKFTRAFRLSHYTSILIGATPPYTGDNEAACSNHAQRVAVVAGLVGHHGTVGLRAYYFAMALLTWFIHPVLFLLTTTVVVIVIFRREHRAQAMKAIAETTIASETRPD